jgi:hypothetical protein
MVAPGEGAVKLRQTESLLLILSQAQGSRGDA